MNRKRYIAIVNPRGGTRRGLAILESVKAVFDGAELDIQTTAHSGHARELAQNLPLEPCDGLIVIGGDGSLHEVVNGLMRRANPSLVPIGLIPGGTGNTVAEHLGCLDPVVAAKRIVAGKIGGLDIARIDANGETEFCANIIGWGAAVDINKTAERLRWLGTSRYTLAALWQIVLARKRRAKITLDGRASEDDFFFIVGANTKFTGKGMKLAPDAIMDDGLIDVVVVRHATRGQMVAMFNKVFDGSHVELPCVEIHRVRSFAIESAAGDLLNMDGELKGSTPLRVEMIPSAMRIFA